MAPFASPLPLLMDGTPDASLAGTLAQARQQLAGSHRTSGYTPAALDAMISDFARYHAALAIVAVVVVVALLGLSVMFWRSFARVVDPPTDPAGIGVVRCLLGGVVADHGRGPGREQGHRDGPGVGTAGLLQRRILRYLRTGPPTYHSRGTAARKHKHIRPPPSPLLRSHRGRHPDT
jgi:hypothetical protein